MSKRLLRQAEAAECLSISPRTLERWRLERRGPSFVKLGRIVAYSEDDLAEWLKSCRHLSISEKPELVRR